MGYPDTFKIPVSDTQAYRQFGNSVVVPVSAFIASKMKKYICTMLEAEKPGFEQARVRKVTRPDRQLV